MSRGEDGPILRGAALVGAAAAVEHHFYGMAVFCFFAFVRLLIQGAEGNH